ncbi:MAG: hypothetical protein HFJ29_01110 [Clostridia bacterium]|nr:hypothetical protein [Clostridia bacterium]
MKTEDDWEELRKWEENKKQNTIFYENEIIKNNRNEKAGRISKGINILGITIGIPLLIIISIITIYLIVMIISLFKEVKKESETEILGQLKNQYSQNFIMIDEKEVAKNEYVYKISPKKDTTIIFTAIQKDYNQVNDYERFLIKKFVEEYVKDYKTTIKINTNDLGTFLKLDYGIEIKQYEEIKSAVEELYNCNAFIEKSLRRMITNNKNFYFNGYLKVGIWNREVPNNVYNKSLEVYQEEIQYDYIDYLEKNKISDSSLDNEEKYKIWKPKEMFIYINGRPITEKLNNIATYNIEIKEYELRLNVLINYVDSIEKLYDKYGRFIGVCYNDKKYEMYYEKNEREGNKIPYQCRISILKDVFQANVEYDYEAQKIFITIK